ncbi:MAG TPA: phosphotransferase [Devosia sp.]|nr:phosphotransferase [Devosia sp.]
MPLSPRDIEPALSLWPELAGGRARLINNSENQTFLVETERRGRFTLRIHRPGYQSRPAIESELAWMAALRRDTDVPIPEPLPGADGQLLQSFETDEEEARHAVLFRFVHGSEPSPDSNMADLFLTLGRYAAQLHLHAMQWKRPPGFERQVWQAATILDADGLWGDWRVAPGVDKTIRSILDRADAALWRRLGEYGLAEDRFGLIHADMRLGNLLVDGPGVTLIDFDDSGFCWFVYDFAAAISFHETHASVPALRAAWIEGYRSVRPLGEEHVQAIDSMVMLRRMALLAWIGSHNETRLAQTHMRGFAAGTAQLAERYLRGAMFL